MKTLMDTSNESDKIADVTAKSSNRYIFLSVTTTAF